MSFQAWITFLGTIFLCLPGVQSLSSVTHSSLIVCGVKGASVVLPCRYEYSWIGTYTEGRWYRNGHNIRDHSDSRYPDCSLRIDQLSEHQSGAYSFQFHTTKSRGWITGSSGVILSVTDPPHVKEDVVVWNQNQTKLTCSTSCSLGSQYVWYKNGQQLQDKTTSSIILDSTRPSEGGSYSCAVTGYTHRSLAVCVPAKQCWGVTYSSTSICALLESSVDIPCTYKYPHDHKIKTAFWFNKQKSLNQFKDLSLNEQNKNHVEYIVNKENNNCTLRLKDIRESHSGEYGFRFTTEQRKDYTGLPGVTITVTTLQVLITPEAVTEGERVTLTCSTTCTVSTNPTIIWYKNRQTVSDRQTTTDKLHLNPVSSKDTGNYSCAVRGHESLSSTAAFLNVTYSPKKVSVFLSLSEIEEDSLVTLTCSSDANPPVHTYTWYMKSGAESLVRGTGESISFNVTSGTSGLYYCEAQNEIGSQNSTEVRIVAKDQKAAVVVIQVGVVLLIFTIILLSGVWLRKRNSRSSTDPHASTVDDVHYTSIRFRRPVEQERSLYSKPRRVQMHRQNEEEGYDSVQLQSNTDTWTVGDSAVYSTVKKGNKALGD